MNTFCIYRERTDKDSVTGHGLATGDWRWSMHASNGKLIAEGGEGYNRGTDLVRTLRKHVVRDSALLETALVRALKRVALDEAGRAKS